MNQPVTAADVAAVLRLFALDLPIDTESVADTVNAFAPQFASLTEAHPMSLTDTAVSTPLPGSI